MEIADRKKRAVGRVGGTRIQRSWKKSLRFGGWGSVIIKSRKAPEERPVIKAHHHAIIVVTGRVGPDFCWFRGSGGALGLGGV
jgi:hypothetical protein